MSNPYRDWSMDDVAKHNERVAKGKHGSTNNKVDRVPPCPVVEPPVRNGLASAPQGETGNATRHAVSVTSFRRRRCDPDNLCPKWFIDSLRYCGFIRNDRAEDIELTVRQVKVKTKAEEYTEITIQPL